MKKSKFFVLASLCSVLAGMPTQACEIKDSTIGGAGGSFNKQKFETPDKANQNKKSEQDSKLLEYLFETVFGLGIIHEGLSYFYGNDGQFYEKPSKYSFVEMCRDDKKYIKNFRYHAKQKNCNSVVQELEKYFTKDMKKFLTEISHRKVGKKDCHFTSYCMRKMSTDVLNSVAGILGCKYNANDYGSKLDFFVAFDSKQPYPNFYLFCCPKIKHDPNIDVLNKGEFFPEYFQQETSEEELKEAQNEFLSKCINVFSIDNNSRPLEIYLHNNSRYFVGRFFYDCFDSRMYKFDCSHIPNIKDEFE